MQIGTSAHDRDVVVLSGVRTGLGKYGGSLKDIRPTRLAALVVREAVQRAGIEPSDVGHVVFGKVIHTDKLRLDALGGSAGDLPPAETTCGADYPTGRGASRLLIRILDVPLPNGVNETSMLKKILVPLDCSALAEQALNHAAELSVPTGATLLLVRAA